MSKKLYIFESMIELWNLERIYVFDMGIVKLGVISLMYAHENRYKTFYKRETKPIFLQK